MAVSLLFFVASCTPRDELLKLEGATMGTRWHVSMRPGADQSLDPEHIRQKLQARLTEIDARFSTWKETSELSRLNQSPLNDSVSISEEMFRLLVLAEDVWSQSRGAFDPTVGPLVDIWGFGPEIRIEQEPPKPALLEQTLSQVGFDKLKINQAELSVSKPSAIELDFSSFAKGYAVDELARLLDEQGVEHYLVEIGGELKLKGFKHDDMPWKIAIEKPVAERGVVQKALLVTNTAVATSGDYRNFFMYRGKRYSHTINPASGMPVEHELASVTVLHPSAAKADAWATAFTVMGEKQALKRAEQLELAVLLLVRDNDNWRESRSKAFDELIDKYKQQ